MALLLGGEMSNSSSALMEGTEDAATIDFGEIEGGLRKKSIRHPIAVFFHLAFRTMALLVYLLCRFFTDSFISSFVCILLLLSMDFWTVKNVTGRLLVGLRWWNYVDDVGKSHWVFESRKIGQFVVGVRPYKENVSTTQEGDPTSDASESSIFWMALIAAPVLWTLFLFISLFGWSFQWLMITLIAIALNGANLYGYIRCRLGKKRSITSAASNFFGQQLLKGMFKRDIPANPNAAGQQS